MNNANRPSSNSGLHGQAIIETIEVLKGTYKSKQLAMLQDKLEHIVGLS